MFKNAFLMRPIQCQNYVKNYFKFSLHFWFIFPFDFLWGVEVVIRQKSHNVIQKVSTKLVVTFYLNILQIAICQDAVLYDISA